MKINNDTALQNILLIEPKTYNYKDRKAKGDEKVYGFIAQQIKEVLPEAIKLGHIFYQIFINISMFQMIL